MITKDEILMGREDTHKDDYTTVVDRNVDKLLIAVNILRAAYGKPLRVTSGFRPPSLNKKIGGATNSAHCTGEACDFGDASGALAKWCLANLAVLEKAGLYMEDPAHTIGWCHVQIRKIKSGNRVFRP